MSELGKVFGFGDIAKWVVVGIIAIIFMVVFFVGYGMWLIALLAGGAIAIFILVSGKAKDTPLWQILLFIFFAFFLTYAVQQLSIYGLSSTFAVEGQMSDIACGLIAVVVVGFVMISLISWKTMKKGIKIATR